MKIKKLSILTFAAVFAFVSIATSMVSLADVKAEEVPAKENKKVATDITGHWMANTLADFNTKGYLVGDENGRVFPDRNMSRAEYAAVINRMMQFTEESGEISKYTDVKSGDWYRADMAKALQAGYIKGTGADTLSPNSTVTREQAFVMLYRLSYPNGVKDQKQAKLTDFSDAGQISEYAKEAISVLVAAGVIQGEFGRLNPKKDITRAQAVLILSKSEKQLAVAMKDLNEQEFVGTGAGYGGTMRVKVVFNKGKITDIKIVSSNETSSYLVRAEKIIAQIIAKQSVEGIDNVSGATLSCNAIKDAVKDCISQQKGLGKIGTVGMTGSGGKSKTTLYEGKNLSEYLRRLDNGTYEGSAQGYRASVNVKVSVKDNRIDAVTIGQNSEDKSYLDMVTPILPKFQGKDSTKGMDAVSGATFTRNGVVRAVDNAVIGANLAKLTIDDFKIGKSGSIKIYKKDDKDLLQKLVENLESVTIKETGTTSAGKRIRKVPVARRMLNQGKLVAEATEKVCNGAVAKGIINATTGKINFTAKDENGNYIFKPNKTYDVKLKIAIKGKAGDGVNLEIKGLNTPKQIDGKIPDGDYKGSADGYRINVPIKLTVTVSGGKITKITVDSHAGEDISYQYAPGSATSYYKDTEKTMIERIIAANGTRKANGSRVDMVSHATMTSEGILKAVDNALNIETGVGSQLESDESAVKAASDKVINALMITKKLKDGVFSGVGKGFNEGAAVRTKVTVKNGEIVNIEILPPNDINAEDTGYIDKAKDLLDYLQGEEAAKNIAIVKCCYKYTKEIEQVKDPEKRNAKAAELLGRKCARIVENITKEASSTDVVREISKAVKTYLAGEYKKDDVFDSVTGATLTSGGIANSVGHAVHLSSHDQESGNDVNELEILGLMAKKVVANRKIPLNLSGMKVKLTKANGQTSEIVLADFAKNGIVMRELGTGENKPVTDGMILSDFPRHTVEVIVEHTASLREDVFALAVDDHYNENWLIGMEYKIGDSGWQAVKKPVKAQPSIAAPFDANNIDVHQKVSVERKEWDENFVGKKLKLRVVRKEPTNPADPDTKYVVAEGEKIIEESDANQELKFFVKDADHKDDLNISFFYKITFAVPEKPKTPENDYAIEKTNGIEIKELPKMQYFTGEEFNTTGMVVILKSSDGKTKEVTPEFFDDFNISTDPEAGMVLTKANAFLKKLKVTFEYGDIKLETESRSFLVVKDKP